MATVRVRRCGQCGGAYAWPLPSDKIWTSLVEGQPRYMAECPHCESVSMLRWLAPESEHPLAPLMLQLQRVVVENGGRVAGELAGNEADAEIRADDEAPLPPPGLPRRWVR